MRLETSTRLYGWLALIFALLTTICWGESLAVFMPYSMAQAQAAPTAQQTPVARKSHKPAPIQAQAAVPGPSAADFTRGGAYGMLGWLWAVPCIILWRMWRKRARQIQALDYQARAAAEAIPYPVNQYGAGVQNAAYRVQRLS